MKISDNPTTLPSALQDEYYSLAMAFDSDLDDDPLDLNEVYVETVGMVVPELCGEKRSLEVRDFERDYASSRARGGYVPGDGSTAVDQSKEGDTVLGHGGVTYKRLGRGDILPGYPTQEGMCKLIIDRMVDDQLRLAGGKSSLPLLNIFFCHEIILTIFVVKVDNRTSSVPAAISRSTNSSEGYPTSFPSTRNIGIQDSGSGYGKETVKERTVPCRMFQFFPNPFTRSLHLSTVDFRILEERRESTEMLLPVDDY